MSNMQTLFSLLRRDTGTRPLHVLLRWAGRIALAGFWLVGTSAAATAQGLSLIRDTEIENLLRSYATPIFEAGGLPPDSVTIHLIQDESINAFVTRGNNMFFNTGLLLASRNSNEVIGVIAHETGHIAGGHAVTFGDSVAAATTTSLLAMLLGIAAGIASNNPDVGMAVVLGGQESARRMLLAFSRDQESRADQFAIKALRDSHQSPQGLANFFKTLSGQEMLLSEQQDPYVRTHPLTRERMNTVRRAAEESPYGKLPPDPEREHQHQRMIAKLYAFLKPQLATMQRYPESDQSIEARYARSIAYFRRGQINKAVPEVDSLIKDEPDDPYFWELKGQMLLETGHVEEAVSAYRSSVELLPDAPLNLVAMAHAMIETGKPKEYAEDAQKTLNAALHLENENPFAWDLLARSYHQSGNTGMSAYAAAEKALLTGQYREVVRYTKEAEKHLEQASPVWYRLQDIRVTAQNELAEIMKRRR